MELNIVVKLKVHSGREPQDLQGGPLVAPSRGGDAPADHFGIGSTLFAS
jgi:hypothetical protein